MNKYIQINLSDIINELGENRTKSILSTYKCPQNKDVEHFLHKNAIEFSKQDLSKTHLVFYLDSDESLSSKRFVGYFTIKTKYITLSKSALSNKDVKRFSKHGFFDMTLKKFIIPAVLIGQLGKNYSNGNNKFILGDDLLHMALETIRHIQSIAGGKYVYLECEEKPQLIDFYTRNGFRIYTRRNLDDDETNLHGRYLIQLLKYL